MKAVVIAVLAVTLIVAGYYGYQFYRKKMLIARITERMGNIAGIKSWDLKRLEDFFASGGK